MQEYLICRSSDEDGKIIFLTYDRGTGKICEYSNDEITRKIVDREICNARLENTVVKITDSRKLLPKLTFEEKSKQSLFYILDKYASAEGSEMILAVSNTGEKFEFSSNLAEDFCRSRQIINAYMTKSGLHVINAPAFTTVLSKSLENIGTH